MPLHHETSQPLRGAWSGSKFSLPLVPLRLGTFPEPHLRGASMATLNRVIVLVTSVCLGACSAEPGGGVLPEPTVGRPTADLVVLPLNVRIRAIAERTRLSRRSGGPSAGIIRRFDRYGRVVDEWVIRKGTRYHRESTLDPRLAAIPLASFVASGEGASLQMTPVVSEVTHTDTLPNHIVTFVDSLSSGGSDFADVTRAPSVSDYLMIGNAWFQGTSSDTLTNSYGADIYVVADSSIYHFEIFDTEYAQVLAAYSSDTSGMMTLRQGTDSPPRGARPPAPAKLGSRSSNASALMQLPEYEDLVCEDEFEDMKSWNSMAMVTTGGAAVMCRGMRRALPSCALSLLIAQNATAVAATYTVNFVRCLKNTALRVPTVAPVHSSVDWERAPVEWR